MPSVLFYVAIAVAIAVPAITISILELLVYLRRTRHKKKAPGSS